MKPTKRKRKRKVEHLYWVHEAEIAESMGIHEVPTVCRRAWMSTSGKRELVKLGMVSTTRRAVVVDGHTDECKLCIRKVEDNATRDLRGR